MPERDPIDDVIADAERTRGTLPPEPDASFQPAAWAAGESPRRRPSKSTPLATAGLLLTAAVVVAGIVGWALSHRTIPIERQFQDAVESLVGRNLKSPATAEFAPDDEWSFDAIDDHTMRIHTWVDSENVFSALLRKRFTTIIKKEAEDWRLLYLKFDDSDETFGKYISTPAEIEAKAAADRVQAAAESAERERLEKARADEAVAKAAADVAGHKLMRQQLDKVRAKSIEIDERRDAEEKVAEAREPLRDARREARETRQDDRREALSDRDGDRDDRGSLRTEIREAVRDALRDQALEAREPLREARRESRETRQDKRQDSLRDAQPRWGSRVISSGG